MPICPTCLTKYEAGVESCPKDGGQLAPDEAYAHVDKDLEAGDLVGEYRVESKIGQGGFGAVYRAVHPVIGKAAAVKVLGRQFSSNPQMVSRFISEARAVNQIGHRNIIDVFSFGQLPDGRQYYVMELLGGTTLDRYVKERGRLSLTQAITILRGIARAMDAAHGKGILHRDLKPENVFLVFDEDGHVQPKLLDFGLVKLLGEPSGSHKTKTGTPMGTPYYMSPEQCRGLDVDARTDVYAFGAMTFELLTGRVPFEGSSTMDILVKHMTEDAPSASSLVPELSEGVDRAIRRMLAKAPENRPETLGMALEELVAGAGVAAPPSVDLLPLPGPASSTPRGLSTLAREAATGPTVADARVAAAAPPHVGQTLLGAESDVAPPRASRTPLLVGAIAAVALCVGGAVAVVSMRGAPAQGGSASTGGGETKTGLVPTAPSGATSAPNAASSASSAPSAAPSASALAEAAPRTVALTIKGAPAGAKITAGDVELGVAPGPVDVKAGAPIELTVSAKGYRSRTLNLTPTEALTIPVSLERQGGQTGQPGPRPGVPLPSDLESFDGKK